MSENLFKTGTPRTAREAFGHGSVIGHDHEGDKLVGWFAVFIVGVLIGVLIAPVFAAEPNQYQWVEQTHE